MFGDEDETTPVVRNQCRYCGIAATVTRDMPFPPVGEFAQPGLSRTCVQAPSWSWCAVRREFAGTLERRG